MPKFIIDAPSSEDHLGAHGRIAEAICQSISGDSRLRFIGLSGRWGSGKSTVMRLLCAALVKQDPRWLILPYDAWAHQSDPARRSFLEELAALLRKEVDGFVDQKANRYWLERIDLLASSIETIKTDTQPSLSTEGKIILPSLVLVPLGIRLLGEGVPSGEIAFTWAASLFTLGWVLSTLPFVLGLVLWGLAKAQGRRFSPLSVIANKPAEIRLETKTKSTEPTAIEFRQIMAGVIDGINKSNRRLLIVVDNLDRLPAAEAVSLWSSIRSVLPKLDEEQFTPVVVVPVDQQILDEAFISQSAGNLKQQSDFVEKSFDITFKVPPPILSNWQRYVENKLYEAIGSEWVADEISSVVSVIAENTKIETKDALTPRQLNATINRIIINHIMWKEFNIPPSTLAHFSISTHLDHGNIKSEISADRPLLLDHDPHWQRNVAAMFFGVPPADAFQVLLSRPITLAIVEKRTADFIGLSSSPGFGGVVVQILRDIRLGDDGFPILYLTALIDHIADEQQSWFRDAWNHLDRLLQRGDYQGVSSPGLVQAYEVLIRRLPAARRKALILREWEKLAARAESKLTTGYSPITELLDLLHKAAIAEGLSVSAVEMSNPAAFEALLASDLTKDQLDLLDFAGDVAALSHHLQERLKSGVAALFAPASFAGLQAKFGSSMDLSPILKGARDAADSGDGVREHAGIEILLSCWGGHADAEQELRALADNGALSRIAEASMSGKNPRQAVQPLAALLLLGEGANLPNGYRLEAADLAWLTEKLSAPKGLTWPRLISASQRQPSTKPLLADLGAGWLVGGRQLDAESFIANSAAYTDLFGAEYQEEFYKSVIESDGIWASINASNVEQVRGVIAAVVNDQRASNDGAKRISDLVTALGSGWLRDVIVSGDRFYDSIVFAARLNNGPPTLHDALRKLGTGEVLNSSDRDFRSRWLRLCLSCGPAICNTVLATVADVIAAGANVQNAEQLLEIEGAALRKAFKRKHSDGVIRHLVQQMLGYDEGRNWVRSNGSEVTKWLKQAQTGTRTYMEQQLIAHGIALTS